MRMHDVFYADQLRKATEPLEGQNKPEQPPININRHPKWPVREILNSRVVYSKRLQYQVAWEAHDPDTTWYNASSFIGAPHKVKQFHDRHPDKPGPPARLTAWLQAYKEG